MGQPSSHTTGHAAPHPAVPTRRLGFPPVARCGPKTAPQAPHASQQKGAHRWPRPFGCHRHQCPFRGRMPAGQFSPSRHRVFLGVSPARCAVVRPLLTPLRVAPSGSPQVRTRCVPARPPHLPPRLNRRLRSVVPARRIAAGLVCGFCSSARRFPLAFLPPAGYPAEVGFE